jgi:hypothetical protein
MIRAKLWFRCAAMHDPVTPKVVQPAVLGWEAKERTVPLTIERVFTGEELIGRMKGWITTDPMKVIKVVKEFAKIKVLDDHELVLEMEQAEDYEKLGQALAKAFGNEVDIELRPKKPGFCPASS